ncbi:6-phosphofructokinase, partial [candidate division WWE3 bacterium]|nr:6-phosphofructokinase [candidate division WWE3 bacterium]
IAIVAEGINEDSSEIAQWFQKSIGIEARVTILGHTQRGGNPSVYDRLMAYKFINYAIDALVEGKEESIVCYSQGGFVYKSIEEVVSHKKILELLI